MNNHDTDLHLPRDVSPIAHLLDELQLYGHRPFDDEPDPRPMPDEGRIAGAIADVFDALVSSLADTRLEPDLEPLLWSTVNLFHRSIQRIERDLDANEQTQVKGRRDQDGSEIRSVELERRTAEGITLLERRNAFEHIREQAAAQFRTHTGSAWRPRSGSINGHKGLTSAVIDSRDFQAARRRSENERLLPPGPKVALTGGAEFNEHTIIWERLDKVHSRHPDMVIIHGGSPKGAERIAACWADNRQVPQIVYKPDWIRHGKAAPFRRNDELLQTMPVGLLAFPGNGIQENLVDKARRLGIPVWKPS